MPIPGTKVKLVLDTFCEVHDLLAPWADAEFWDFDMHETVAGAVYLFGRQQFQEHKSRIVELARNNIILPVISNPHEGSDTLRRHIQQWGVEDLVKNGKILAIGGGDMDSQWPCLRYDSFLPKVLDYDENIAAQARSDEIYTQHNKPYKFLFLNGRGRPHRRDLIALLQPVLAQAIWSNLDTYNGAIKTLSAEYEFDFYQNKVNLPTTGNYVKPQLFNGDWGEIYLKPEPYIDTAFSLVTETVFNYPYSFRTEKIWKPIVMGHPFVVAANQGYLRDLRQLGFRTFGHLIDESYDSIENSQQRVACIAQVVTDLCGQDLDSFVQTAKEVCKYNQQHYAALRPQVRQEFPQRFAQFIQQEINE